MRESGTSIQPIAGQGAANPDYDLVFSDIRVEHERPKHELAEFMRDNASSRFFRDLFVSGTVLNGIGCALLLVVGIWLTIRVILEFVVYDGGKREALLSSLSHLRMVRRWSRLR